ncbi:hypothetical protein GWN42_18370 [candidate division KSB1 bacterium]|nr:hypothetical protein [candidate division KSB1 bacterium]
MARKDLTKRFDILNRFIAKHGFTIGAEIGTGNGKTALEVLRKNPKLMLIQVAFYPGPESLPKKHYLYCTTGKAQALWKRRIRRYSNQVRIIMASSENAALKVPDESLDFVFIDADHSYEHCLQDNQLWYPKVRSGGLVCGHDYHTRRFPGVVQAVDEFYGRENIRLKPDRFWYLWKR